MTPEQKALVEAAFALAEIQLHKEAQRRALRIDPAEHRGVTLASIDKACDASPKLRDLVKNALVLVPARREGRLKDSLIEKLLKTVS